MAKTTSKAQTASAPAVGLDAKVTALERRVSALEAVLRSFGQTVVAAPMFDGGDDSGDGGGSEGGAETGDGGGSEGGGDGSGGDGGEGGGDGSDRRTQPKRTSGRVARR